MVKKVSKTEARQGVTGHNVRFVLGISLLLAVFALSAIGLYAS